MNIKLNLFALAVSLILLINCNNNSRKESVVRLKEVDSNYLLNQEKENHNTGIQQEIKSKSEYDNSRIKIIDSKREIREIDGNFNQMTLFEVNKDISLEQLKEYCSTVKPNYTDGYFQILVFFKNPNSARFPNNPITALHNEENDSKNIKAVYTINNMNSYSKLDYYEKNKWESLAQTIDIN